MAESQIDTKTQLKKKKTFYWNMQYGVGKFYSKAITFLLKAH